MVGLGKEWIEEQGNEGRGRTEKTLILHVSQSSLFSPEDERAGGGLGVVHERGSEKTLLIPKLRLCVYIHSVSTFSFHSLN